MPPLPRPNSPTSSRLAYLRRNLRGVVSVWVRQAKVVRGRKAKRQPGEPPPMGAPWNLRYHDTTRHRGGPEDGKLNCNVRSRMRGCVCKVYRTEHLPSTRFSSRRLVGLLHLAALESIKRHRAGRPSAPQRVDRCVTAKSGRERIDARTSRSETVKPVLESPCLATLCPVRLEVVESSSREASAASQAGPGSMFRGKAGPRRERGCARRRERGPTWTDGKENTQLRNDLRGKRMDGIEAWWFNGRRGWSSSDDDVVGEERKSVVSFWARLKAPGPRGVINEGSGGAKVPCWV